MSRDPTSLALLEAAHRTLIDEIAGAVLGNERYTVLLAANAIAVRELGGGDEVLHAETDSAASHSYEDSLPAGESAEAVLAALERRLVAAIRAGAFDGKE